MNRGVVMVGALLILTGIIFGAFGAHALEEFVNTDKLLSFETGVRYQIYHGLAFIILGANADKLLSDSKLVIRLMLSGLILFSVSIYLLALQEPLGVSFKFMWPITPIGGMLMIVAWGLFIKNLLTNK